MLKTFQEFEIIELTYPTKKRFNVRDMYAIYNRSVPVRMQLTEQQLTEWIMQDQQWLSDYGDEL